MTVLCLDLDGVLADWATGFRALMQQECEVRVPEGLDTHWDWPNMFLHPLPGGADLWLPHLWRKIKSDPEWWLNLQPYPGVKEVISELVHRRGLGWKSTSSPLAPGDRSGRRKNGSNVSDFRAPQCSWRGGRGALSGI